MGYWGGQGTKEPTSGLLQCPVLLTVPSPCTLALKHGESLPRIRFSLSVTKWLAMGADPGYARQLAKSFPDGQQLGSLVHVMV
jgi:hypothetical protein